jgi:hypothetical protein
MVLNSLLHTGILLLVWWAVSKRWLFRWVPN